MVGADGGDKLQRVAGGDPAQHRGHGGKIDGGNKPAHHIAVAFAHGGLGVVHHAVDLFVFLSHEGEGQQTDHHNHAADDPRHHAQRHIAAGHFEDILRFEKDSGADNDAHHHANGGE